MARIAVGPVVGKVTQTTARVLVETDADAVVLCTAKAPGKPSIVARVECPRERPRILFLDGLQPETEYRLEFAGATERAGIRGRVRTLSDPCDSMNMAAVSCNKTYLNGDTDLWADLGDRYVEPGDVNYLLHVGDQIYGDDAFREAQELLGSSTTWPSRPRREAIMERFRRLYRLTWSWPSTARVLARVPNLMIWDDHEIRDDWGSRATDKLGSEDQAFVIGRLARQVYREYQRQLWDDIDVNSEAPDGSEHHHHIFGGVGVIFVDQRGGRSFSTSPSRPFLGVDQWDELKNRLLSLGGAFDQVRALIVVTSVPLVYLGPNLTTFGERAKDDLADHWAYGTHAKEQLEFIRLLRRWKEDKPDARELLVVGGDVHVGGDTEIRHLDKPIFDQLITGPITNKPPRFWEFKGLQLALEQDQSLGDSYTFEHSGFRNRRNYAVIIARGTTNRPPLVKGSLHFES